MRLLAIALTLCLVLPLPAVAGDVDLQAKAFSCNFESGLFTSFENGAPESEPSGELSFVFASVDLEKGSAQMVGNNGAADVFLLAGSRTLHFLEQTPTGNLNVTTIYQDRSDNGHLIAVHSRHVGVEGDPWMSQYWGTCEARN